MSSRFIRYPLGAATRRFRRGVYRRVGTSSEGFQPQAVFLGAAIKDRAEIR